MKVSCQSCSSVLNIDDNKIPAGGARIKCPICQTIFPVRPGGVGSPASNAVPLPGSSSERPRDDEATRVADLRGLIPGATTSLSGGPSTVVGPTTSTRPGRSGPPSSSTSTTRTGSAATVPSSSSTVPATGSTTTTVQPPVAPELPGQEPSAGDPV